MTVARSPANARSRPPEVAPSTRAVRAALTAMALGAAVVAPGHAAEPAAPAAPAASASTTRDFDIPAGPLAEALTRFATAAGVRIEFDAAALAGARSAGLRGNHATEQGLAALLAGSGYEAQSRGASAFALSPVAAAAAAPASEPLEVQTLQTVTVVANQLGEITEGTGSYTPGAIATATRLVLKPRETPQTISVTTRAEMEDFNLTSIDKVMQHTPGVSIVTYDSERTEYYARGFAISNFQYDGIPMLRDSAYSSGNTLSDTAIYDRIEVLKGATGLLTGSGDPGATINLIRKKPTRKFQGHVTLGAGSWDDYRGEFDLSGGLNSDGSVRGRVVVAQADRSSWLDHYQRTNTVFYGILEADLTPDTLLTVGLDSQNSDPMGSNWGGIPLLDSSGNFNELPRSFNNGARWSHWDQYARTAFATLQHDFDNGWVAKAQFNHQINGYDANLGGAASGNPDPVTGEGVGLWVGQYIGKTTADALDVYASGPYELFGRKHELVVGGSFSKRQWKNKNWWTLTDYDYAVPDYPAYVGNVPEPVWGDPDYVNDETTRESGFYLASRFNLRDDLKAIAGARVSNYKKDQLTRNGVVVPYFGVVYDLNKSFSVYGSYTGIFKPQAEQDEQGRTLDPREGKNYEIGLKSSHLRGRLNTSLAYFQLQQDNYPEATGNKTPTGGDAFRAIQGVETKGFEAEVSGQLSRGWEMRAGYSHKVSRERGRKVDTLAPENQFTLYTSYQLPGDWSGLTLGGGARWEDKTWGEVIDPATGDTITHTVKGHTVLDLTARYEFNDKLSASFSVNNLLDKKYYTIFSWYSTYTWGAPRSVNASMTYRF